MNTTNEIEVRFTVNGDPRRLTVKTNRTLLDLIRADLGLTGTKKGCGMGKCGQCQINGEYVCQNGPVYRYLDAKRLREAL